MERRPDRRPGLSSNQGRLSSLRNGRPAEALPRGSCWTGHLEGHIRRHRISQRPLRQYLRETLHVPILPSCPQKAYPNPYQIQTTFTPLESQDPDNVPYSKDDDPAVQAKTSIEASLDMFRDPVSGEAYLDAAILHAPYPSMTTTTQVLRAMSSFGGPGGRVRQLGISNVTEAELRDVHARGDFLPQIVQNRCRYTNGLDRTARAFCKAHHIVYQAFGVLQNEPLLEDERTVLEVARALAVSREAALYALVMVALGADDHPGNLYEDVKVLNGTADVQHMREDLEQVNRALCALKDAALWEVVRLDRARQDLGLHGKQEERGTHPKEQHAFLGEDRSVVLLDESLGSKLRQAMESFRNGIGEP